MLQKDQERWSWSQGGKKKKKKKKKKNVAAAKVAGEVVTRASVQVPGLDTDVGVVRKVENVSGAVTQQGGEDSLPLTEEQQGEHPASTTQCDPAPNPTPRVFVFGSSDIRERWKQVGLGPKSADECRPPKTRRQKTDPGMKKLSSSKVRTQQMSMESWVKNRRK